MNKGVFVGVTYTGPHRLPECANDARSFYNYCKLYFRNWDFSLITGESLSWNDLKQALLWLRGARIAMFMYSGHGFRVKESGKPVTGLYTGEYIPHEKIMREALGLVIPSVEWMLRIYDCCYGGSAVRVRDNVEIRVKSVSAESVASDDEVAAYKMAPSGNDAVIAACRPKQVAYGAFRGGVNQCFTLNTLEHSLFSFHLGSAFLWRCNMGLHMVGDDLNFRCKNMLSALPPDRRWKNKEFVIPDVVCNVPKRFPHDFARV